MPLTRPRLDEHLRAIEVRVPAMMRNRDMFARAFEDETERLPGHVSEGGLHPALARREAIVERSGFNR